MALNVNDEKLSLIYLGQFSLYQDLLKELEHTQILISNDPEKKEVIKIIQNFIHLTNITDENEQKIRILTLNQFNNLNSDEKETELSFLYHLNKFLLFTLANAHGLIKEDGNIDLETLNKKIHELEEIVRTKSRDNEEKIQEEEILERLKNLKAFIIRLSNFEKTHDEKILEFRNNIAAAERVEKIKKALEEITPKDPTPSVETKRQHAQADVTETMKKLGEIREKSQKISKKSNLARSVSLFFTNFPAWVLMKIEKSAMTEQDFNKPGLEVINGSKSPIGRAAIGIGIPAALAVAGISTNLLSYIGVPWLAGIISGVGAGIAVKNGLDLVGRASVLKRTETQLKEITSEIKHASKTTDALNGKGNVGKLGADIRGTDINNSFEDILTADNLSGLKTYLTNNPKLITDYAKAIAERVVTLAAHDPMDENKMKEFLEYHVQGLAALIAIKNQENPEFIREEDVKAAQNLINEEIEKASKKGKWFQFLKWTIGIIVGTIVGWFTFNKLSPQETKVNVEQQSTTSTIPAEQALIGQQYIKIWDSEVSKLIQYMKDNKDSLVGKTLGQIVEEAGISNEIVKQRLLESFDTGMKMKAETIEGFIRAGETKASDGISELAHHLERVHGAKDVLGMNDTHPLIKEVAEGFTEAKQGEVSKWQMALGKLKDAINSSKEGVKVASEVVKGKGKIV